MFIYIYL